VTDDGDGSAGPESAGPATVSITVNPVNDAPVANDTSRSADEDQVVTVDLRTLVSDDETAVDDLTFAVSNPSGGSVQLLSDGFTAEFTPTAGFNGLATFQYTAQDDNATPLTSAPATVSIDYSASNSTPTANNGNFNTDEDVSIDVDLRTLADDVETADDDLVFAVDNAVNGTVQLLSDGYTARFTPADDYNGPASFTYTVTDTGDGADPPATAGPATVNITVDPVNDMPTVDDAVLPVLEDQSIDVDLRPLANDLETADDDLIFSVFSATNGSVQLLGDGFTARFTPTAHER